MTVDKSDGNCQEESKKQQSPEDIAEIMYKERADSIVAVVKRPGQNGDE